MRIAIFHNFLDNIGGAEIVDLMLARKLDADVYTTNIDWDKINKMGFGDVRIHSIGRVPIQPPFRQEIAYWKFRRLKLKGYDFYIIAGDWAVGAGRYNKPNLWYVHSPMREIFDLYKYTRKNTLQFFKRPIFDLWVLFRRFMIRRDTRDIGKVACNSKNVQKRVRKYLRKSAVVIHPCIDFSKYVCSKEKGYWLSVNRLINHKRVDMQIEAFSKMPKENLIIVGSYEGSNHFKKYVEKIFKVKPANVEIRSFVDDFEIKKLYSECKGFITTSKNEDFGLTVLEAMASGKFVIAPKEGGYKETVLDGKTGVLIEEINSDRIVREVKKKRDFESYKENCFRQAKNFDVKVFVDKIRQEIYGTRI